MISIRQKTNEELKKDATVEFESNVNILTDGVPQAEIQTWTKQESEARAYLADNTSSTPLIDALKAARGVDKDYLVNKIIEKSDAYAVAIGTYTGERQKKEDELNS